MHEWNATSLLGIPLDRMIRLGSEVPVEPHEAVAEVSRIGNVLERLVVVNHG